MISVNWDLSGRKDVCTKTRSFAPLRMTGFELYAHFVILSEAKNLILTKSNYSTNYPKGAGRYLRYAKFEDHVKKLPLKGSFSFISFFLQ